MRCFFHLALMFGLLFVSGGEVLAQIHPKHTSALTSDKAADPTGCETLRQSRIANGGGGIINDMMNSGGAICPCAPAPGLWLDRIVSCFAGKPDGLIYNSVGSIVTHGPYRDFYVSLVSGCILLAVVLFGFNLTLGAVQSIPKDSFILILKIGGVTLFFSKYMWVYGLSLDMVQGLATTVSTAAGNMGNLCDTAAGSKAPTLWASWDCLFLKFTGLIGGALSAGIFSIVLSLFFSGGIGVGIGFGLLYVVLMLLLIAMRLVFTYLVAILAISFLFLLAPLFVPMLLFGLTYKQFTTWFKMMIAYALQPMLLMLFMILMLVALEFTIFVGPTSLFTQMSNKEQTEVTTFSEALGLTPTGTVAGGIKDVVKAVTKTATDDWSKYIKRSNIFEFTRHVSPEVETLSKTATDKLNDKLVDTGIWDKMSTLSAAAAQSGKKALDDLGSHTGGIMVYKIDWNGFMKYLSKKGTQVTEEQWLQNVILQLMATAILVFILYNMVLAVPQITHDLVAQQFGAAFGSATKMRMVGENEMRWTLNALKETVRRSSETGDMGKAVSEVVDETLDGAAGTTGQRGGAS
ncbi:MAG: type IV secretion system protein [Rickettsiales bacterium]|nr:type IV secretion system protein [Rickettsiales bacterium]